MADPAPVQPVAATVDIFCRGCGYSLRGLPGGNCPECGRGFDLGDRRTVADCPPRLRLRWWAWRVGLLLVVLMLGAGSVPVYYWWGWHREQAVIAAVRGAGGRVDVQRVELGGAAKFLPARWAFVHERAVATILRVDATDVLDRLDLGPLVHVGVLELWNCRVTDSMLSQLRGMTKLERLFLACNPRLDGTGLRHLAECRALAELDLSQTGLSDAGLAEVGRLTALQALFLSDTHVTDAGIGHVARLTSLAFLDLRRTVITDAGLMPLHGMASLQVVRLGGTKVTDQAKRDLQKALPNLMIDG